MQDVVTLTNEVLDVLIRLVILAVPVLIAWLIRTYVRSSAVQNNVASIMRLANTTIDYVENLDKRGDLVLPPDVRKGGYKLKLASQWLESELNQAGIKVDTEQAEKWVAAEFQKRVGDVRPVAAIAETTRAAVDLIQDLERNKMVTLPPEVDRSTHLAALGADWLVAQLAKCGTAVTRDEALTWIRAEIAQRLQQQVNELPVGERLVRLAEQAVEFLDRLKASGQIAVRPGATDEDIETDIATAWLLTEAAKQGLTVSSDQIARAAAAALRQRPAESRALVVAQPQP